MMHANSNCPFLKNLLRTTESTDNILINIYFWRPWSRLSIRSSISNISNMLDKTFQKAKDSNIRFGLLLAAASGILLTFYSFMLRNIKNEIDKNMVLLLRGVLQTTAMAGWSLYKRLSFFPSVSNKLKSSSVISMWALAFCTVGNNIHEFKM